MHVPEQNNFRQVSIISVLARLFESLLRKQTSEFFETILPKFQEGFREGYEAWGETFR